MHLASLEKMASTDLCLNDLYYTVKSRSVDAPLDTNSGKVILLNTGSFDSDSFRAELAKLLVELRNYNPVGIGLDFYFSSDTSIPGTPALIDQLNKTPNLVMGKRNAEVQGENQDGRLASNADYGSISFPGQQISIRRYASDTGTFGYKLAEKLAGKGKLKPFRHNTFVIHYLTQDLMTKEEWVESINLNPLQSRFLKLEAREILQADSAARAIFSQIIKGKIVLVGHLGPPNNSKFDVEDKLRVPVDSNLVNRDRTMYGVLIHANAIENLLNPQVRFSVWSDATLFKWLVEILLLLFLAYIIFVKAGKVINITLLTLFSIPMAILVLYLMKSHIYLEMGLTLIHFILFEELVKILKPVYHKIEVWMQK
jgi:CHASE2 domain-containing sensor protein